MRAVLPLDLSSGYQSLFPADSGHPPRWQPTGQHYGAALRVSHRHWARGARTAPTARIRVNLQDRRFRGSGIVGTPQGRGMDDGRAPHNHRPRRPLFREWGGHWACLDCLRPPDGPWGHGIATNLTTIQLRDRLGGFVITSRFQQKKQGLHLAQSPRVHDDRESEPTRPHRHHK